MLSAKKYDPSIGAVKTPVFVLKALPTFVTERSKRRISFVAAATL